jgi:hypothetical protein
MPTITSWRLSAGGTGSLLFSQKLARAGDGVHDLERMLEEIHRDYFPGTMRLPIQWGKQIGRKKRRSIRLGSFDHRTRIIRIHPSLDRRHVPAFFIQSVIHHEYLHHVLGPDHDSRFHRHEKQFRFHREAKLWLKRNLYLLLGLRPEPLRLRKVVPPPARPVQLSLF